MTNEELLSAYNAHERRLSVVEERVAGIAESVIKEAQFERTIIPLREKLDQLTTILTDTQKANQEAQRANQQAQRANQEELHKLAQAVSEISSAAKKNSDSNQEIMKRIGDINEENMREAARQVEENHQLELEKKQAEIEELRENRWDRKMARLVSAVLKLALLIGAVTTIAGVVWAIIIYVVKAAMAG